MIETYPLQWPPGWPRTKYPRKSIFNTKHAHALKGLLAEMRLLGAKKLIINSNLTTYHKNGILVPHANQKVKDNGVATYFQLNEKQLCIPCDKWKTYIDNVHAIQLTVSALRGIERWGAKEMVNAAFQGFKALPYGDSSNEKTPPRYFEDCDSIDEVRSRYKILAKELHPDVGGNSQEFAEMHAQYQEEMSK